MLKKLWTLLAIASCSTALAQEPDLSVARLNLMRTRAQNIRFQSEAFEATTVEPEPLFRYDDLPRGYQDGTVWRLGQHGRPAAIITTELHPQYGMHGTDRRNPRVVYDFLSLSPEKFRARSKDIVWTPSSPAIEMKPLPLGIARAASSKPKRLLQLKELARRFQAIQVVSEVGTVNQQLVLRLLPQHIDRYVPAETENADGAVFLFVAGRMPGIVLLLETDGQDWSFGVGRLSGPSELSVSFDENLVWSVQPNVGGSNEGYYATNAPADLPGE